LALKERGKNAFHTAQNRRDAADDEMMTTMPKTRARPSAHLSPFLRGQVTRVNVLPCERWRCYCSADGLWEMDAACLGVPSRAWLHLS